MAYRTIAFEGAEITDSDTSDGVVVVGGLRFTVTAQGNWTLNFSNGRLNFAEDVNFAGSQFKIEITSVTTGALQYNDFIINYQANPMAAGDWPTSLSFTGGPSISDTDLSGNYFHNGEFSYKNQISGFPPMPASPVITKLVITDNPAYGSTQNPYSAFWLDQFVVDTDFPPSDTVAPIVASVTRSNAAPEATNSNVVSYTVVFSEAVTGVDLGDFVLATSGTATGQISAVSGSGTTYTVTVSNLTGYGTLRLDLTNTGTGIRDLASNPIGSGYSSGEQYSLVNDAPVLSAITPTLTGLTEDDLNTPGQAVSSILGSSVSDVDANAVKGIAVIGSMSGNGTWQYSTDGGASWDDMGGVSAGSALLLRATDRVRFIPDGVNGTTGSLTYRAWDQTGATAGQHGTKVDATTAGGSTPFSSATDTATITVTAVNDAPVASTSGGAAAFTEGDNSASVPVVIDAGLTLSDSDNAALASATVSIVGNFVSGQDILAFVNNNAASFGDIIASYNNSTGVLTLTSAGATTTVAQWQAALRSVTYLNASETPSDATRVVSFTVHDGQDSSNSAIKNVIVTSTNDAPVHHVPAAQAMAQDAQLVFSSASGNGITISDSDVGSGMLSVTLTAAQGLLTLSSTSGLSFIVGTGSADATMTFQGNLADLNNALNGLVFTPHPGHHGPASIQIGTSDLGSTGSGGAQTDSDVIAITVGSREPAVTGVNVTNPDGRYKAGDTLYITVSFDQAVTVNAGSGAPTLLLETGNVDRQAAYLSGSGTTTLSFAYTVQEGDVSADLDYHSTAALLLNGATIRNAAQDDATLTLPVPGGAGSIAGQHAIVIENAAPPSEPGPVVTPNEGGGVDITITDPSQLTAALGTGGIDQVIYGGSGTVILPDTIENITLAGGDARAQGNSLGNAMRGSAGDNVLVTMAGNDWVHGGNGRDTVDGGTGRDYMFGGTGNDLIQGDSGDDKLQGAAGNDQILGGSGNDGVYGGHGDDRLSGGVGHDRVNGGLGHDWIYGGSGNDMLYGGSGLDRFMFDTKLNTITNTDKILDFKASDDSIFLDDAIFGTLGRGSVKGAKLEADMFVIDTQAQDAEDRIIYDRDTGSLYYDRDGTGSAGQVKFATLTNKAELSYHDLFVI